MKEQHYSFQAMKYFLVLFVLIVVNLTSCGSSSSDKPKPAPPVQTQIVNGIAAAGAPIVGTVNIRGADGQTSLSEIRSDGSYTVDVTALTPPFLIWANGSANGRSVHLYSTISSPGTVNVTPATDIIVASALGQDPAEYYQANPNAAVPSATDIEDAKTMITGILSSVFASLNMPPDFDLMNGSFTVGGSGFDQVLDAVGMTSEGTTVSMQDNASGTVLLQDDLTTPEVETQLSSEDVEDVVMASMGSLQQINEIFATILGLYATEKPSLETLTTTARPLMSDDFLDDGKDPDELIEAWAYAPACEGPGVGMELVSVVPYRDMTLWTFPTTPPQPIDEKGDNFKGIWCVANIRANDRMISFITSFVQPDEGAAWVWYGNRNPFRDGGDVDIEAIREIHPDGTSMISGLDLYIEDDGNVALTRSGINYILLFNAAFPEVAIDAETGESIRYLTLSRNSQVDTRYSLPGNTGNFYSEDMGLNIDNMTSLEFLFFGFEMGVSGLTVKAAWIDVLPEKPLKTSELTSDMFPTITTPTSSANLLSSIPGIVTVSWDAPEGKYVDEVSLRWWGNAGETWMDNDNPATCGNPDVQASSWVTTTFDTSETMVVSPWSAILSVQAHNESESQEFETRWFMGF